MKHFIVYHKFAKMGPLENPSLAVTTNSVKDVMGGAVWLITGEGNGKTIYSLASVFIVDAISKSPHSGKKHSISGKGGHAFEPPIVVGSENWFPAFRKSNSNFSLGFRQIKDETVLAALTQIAADAGFVVAT